MQHNQFEACCISLHTKKGIVYTTHNLFMQMDIRINSELYMAIRQVEDHIAKHKQNITQDQALHISKCVQQITQLYIK